MTMINFDDRPANCEAHTNLLVPFTPQGTWAQILVDGLVAQDFWPWARTQLRQIDSLSALRAQIAILNAEIAALQQKEVAAEALCGSCATVASNFHAELELRSARLRVHALNVALRHLEVLGREQVRETLGCDESDEGGVSSPSWEMWQSFIIGAPIEMVALPSDQALAQEMVDAGLLRRANAAFAASVIRYLTTSIAMKMERVLFFQKIARPFVHDYLETLSMAAASVRTLAARWMLDGPCETGSAAAIARRLNPLGAPPHFA
ncbi:hypothetical protein [Paraburkholderia caledonica]|uniref:hypothetical protein n=1 Tax=Paraburkholderia caledonica TaxID=134536 RepID=UPI000374573A|nr:hypothetical protein [Paraburkholderia caledonica]